MIRDLTDEEARRALPEKWGSAEPDVLPAWVAEMDFALAPAITEALSRAVSDGMTGYPRFGVGGELAAAYAGFAQRRHGMDVDPDQVIPVVDVTAGVRLALDVLSGPGPLVLPVPAYSPHLGIAEVADDSGSIWSSTRTRPGQSWTLIGSTDFSRMELAPCCSPSHTTRGAGSSRRPSWKGSAT